MHSRSWREKRKKNEFVKKYGICRSNISVSSIQFIKVHAIEQKESNFKCSRIASGQDGLGRYIHEAVSDVWVDVVWCRLITILSPPLDALLRTPILSEVC